ncbi:hypothetical protein [Marivivens sp. JLT3646]|uniref:hypothetical protein n=1 Tax=Marivivens sp. JLT3646 TaxID=1920883 RepID=UPI0007FF56C0|nr:hypothetical protein [Marivivens sp. JLT3646]APO87938.1 hypothetical protein BSK21_13480 [Marivivens sp. JLT3646]OBR35139.1 hypothetical protein A9199_12085 [Donghicola sp. JL3646]
MSKITDKQISLIMKQMGFDPLYLTKELRKKHVQKMTLKERCEYINHMRLPFGIVRCTPHRLLKKWLGMDLLSVMNFGINFYRKSKDLNFLFNSCFHISHIDGSEVIDYGFFTLGENAEYSIATEKRIDEVLEEGVIDLSTFDGDYIVGFGPKTFEKFK